VNYVRVARDQRGYETTMLLHSPRPGARPRVLYWYRTAPGVRVGRAPLDEEAIRTIEERHPDIEFDWPQLFEEASNIPPDAERRPERPRRRVPRAKESAPTEVAALEAPLPEEDASEPVERAPAILLEPELLAADVEVVAGAEPHLRAFEPASDVARPLPPQPPRGPANPLLDQLVGREIATRLRARHDEVAIRIAALDPSDARRAWQARADALDPDRWSSPEAILAGIQNADRLFDELKRELP
jgi:hypothetical protein